MIELTLEEMKKAVLDLYPRAWAEHVNNELAHATWWVIRLPYGEISSRQCSEDVAWWDAYSKLPKQPAPESEDEAFERWFRFESVYVETTRTKQIARSAWNARARLSAGGK